LTKPLRRVSLHYALTPPTPDGVLSRRIRNPLFTLLAAVQESGSIAAAARVLGVSYRHAWGELKRWESDLGAALLHWEKGQAARLTDCALKLLWAERQAQARLAPQIEQLHADLERSFAIAFDPNAHVLALHASHDLALPVLREFAASRATRGAPALHLDIHFMGSVDAIAALNQGRCRLAGFHVPSHAPRGSHAERSYRPLLKTGVHKLIGFAERTQGLIVPPGNPLGLRSLADVTRQGARFASRPLGSGTRLVLLDLLAAEGLDAAPLLARSTDEPSHAAVAQAVAAGLAEAGLGIPGAARELGLDFVPLVTERYFLVCLKHDLDQPPLVALRQRLASAGWQQALAALPGYAPSASGQVLSLHRTLPWWNLKSKAPKIQG